MAKVAARRRAAHRFDGATAFQRGSRRRPGRSSSERETPPRCRSEGSAWNVRSGMGLPETAPSGRQRKRCGADQLTRRRRGCANRLRNMNERPRESTWNRQMSLTPATRGRNCPPGYCTSSPARCPEEMTTTRASSEPLRGSSGGVDSETRAAVACDSTRRRRVRELPANRSRGSRSQALDICLTAAWRLGWP